MIVPRRKIGNCLWTPKTRREPERRDVTVCIAMAFIWNYGPDHGGFGQAILTASDRMLTAGDLQYEPRQQKISRLTPSTLLMVAGDMTVHTEAITYALDEINLITAPKIAEVVDIYAKHIKNIRRRRAETLYLEPLGLDIKSFNDNQKNMLPQIAVEITNEVRTYRLDVEALIVGCLDESAFIYHIDGEGLVTHHHELNFASIGIGNYQVDVANPVRYAESA